MTDTAQQKPAYNKPLPALDDPLWAGFWSASREGRITAQRCADCAQLRFPALPICTNCQSLDSSWVDVSPSGTIWSYAVYHRAFHPGFAADLPYVVADVETDDGLHYVGMIVGGPRPDITVGAKVRAVFDEQTPEFTLLKWDLAT